MLNGWILNFVCFSVYMGLLGHIARKNPKFIKYLEEFDPMMELSPPAAVIIIVTIIGMAIPYLLFALTCTLGIFGVSYYFTKEVK